jgi:hypothetical protein
VITLGPVFVIADPARTVKLRAVPNLGWVAAEAAAGQAPTTTAVTKTSSETIRELLNTAPTISAGALKKPLDSAEVCSRQQHDFASATALGAKGLSPDLR